MNEKGRPHVIMPDLFYDSFQLSLIHTSTLFDEFDMTAWTRYLDASFSLWNSDLLLAVRTAVNMIMPSVLYILSEASRSPCDECGVLEKNSVFFAPSGYIA